MKPYSIWLWQNQFDQSQQQVSWCSKEQIGTIKTDSIFSKDYLDNAQQKNLRDEKNSLCLQDLLGEVIFTTFSFWLQNLKHNEYLRLHFINTLPENWQQLPLEWSVWQGERLGIKLQCIRYAPLPKMALAIHPRKQALILNLWPLTGSNQQFFNNIIYDRQYHVIRGYFKITLYLRNNDISNLAFLCVIAHGNEADLKKPLLCERNQPWALPDKQLPPLVLLIACGGEQGNLLNYAQTLLAQGAKTVLAAKGKLDASQATDFLAHFLQHWKKGLDAADILFQLQQQKNSEHAAQRIYIIGQSTLNPQPIPALIKESTKENYGTNWHALSQLATQNNPALLTLLNQLSLHNLVHYSSLESSVNDLYQALSLDYNDPHEKRSQLYDRLLLVFPHCLPITQKWLSYFLLYLSSLHQHHDIDTYHQETIRLQNIKAHGLDGFFFYMASAKYRSRQHPQAMQIIVDGLNPLTANKKNHEAQYKLVELALNISIVMTLPELGQFFLEQSNQTVLHLTLDHAQQSNETFTQLDRTARLLIRTGDPDNEANGDAGLIRGLYELQEKRLIAIKARKETGERELCLLLYFSAWLTHEIPNPHYSQQALTLLAPVKKISQELSSKTGNITKLYLLRALAAWAWRQQDKQAIALLEQYLPTIITLSQNVSRNNSAPLGFIIAYLALLGNPQAKQHWFAISHKMQSDHCYFELALFYKFLKQDEKAISAYKKHRQQQHHVFDTITRLQQCKCLDQHKREEYKHLLLDVKQRLEKEEDRDIITIQLADIQRLGFIPF